MWFLNMNQKLEYNCQFIVKKHKDHFANFNAMFLNEQIWKWKLMNRED